MGSNASIRESYPNERIIKAIEDNDGLIKHAAKELQVTRRTLNNWIYGNASKDPPMEKDQELIEAVQDAREGLIDDGESHLAKNVRDGKEASIFFLLKTLGKDRGYVERQEWAEHVEQPLFDDEDDIEEGHEFPEAED